MEQSMANACQRMRETGNVVYKQLAAGPCKFAKPVRRMKLTQAEQHYKSALAASRSPADRAACLKNLGMLHFLWSKFEVNDAVDDLEEGRTGPGQSSSGPQLAFAKTKVTPAVDYLLKAIREGKSAGNSQAWLEGLDTVLLKMVEWAEDQTKALQLPHAPLLRCLCEGFDIALARNPNRYENSPAAVVIAHLRLAERLFQQGVLHLIGGDDDSQEHELELELDLDLHRDYKACLSFLHDALQFLRKAQTVRIAEAELSLEIIELQERVETQIFVCESMQAREMGDEALRAAIHGDVQVNMELALQAIDWFRQATVLTRDRDIEGEAIAMSRLGKVYSEVLKDAARASKAHYQATKLALTVMSPRISRSRWYKYSVAKHGEFQAKVVRDEERQHEQQRAPTKQKLHEEIRKLDAEAKKGGRAFLVHIYQNHPNPDPKKQPGEMLKEKKLTKEMLRKAISHYHPDVNGQHGEEWQVLCEEISKILNNKYEYFKLERDTA